MKPCMNADHGCKNQIDDRYKYCPECIKLWKETHPKSVEGGTNTTPQAAKPSVSAQLATWHSDPTVAALLQLNSNAGNIVKAINNAPDNAEVLERIVVALERIAASMEKAEKKKGK
jgi:hypothetical protein